MRTTETEVDRWNELVSLAQALEPDLVPLLAHAREGGMIVKRYHSGDHEGALYISMSERDGADYSRWAQLNCGPGLEMYKLVQDASQRLWKQASEGGTFWARTNM